MVDITHKSFSLRSAVATAVVRMSRKESIEAIRSGSVPKGNVLECARVAGLFAVKRTSDMIPDCHPLPIESAEVRYALSDMEISIEVEVKTVYKTGVEVEVMHGASVVALTIYDMLKPLDKGIEITGIKLKEKHGGRSDQKGKWRKDLKAAVVVCSDSVSTGRKEDSAGKAIIKKLESCEVSVSGCHIIADEATEIQRRLSDLTEAGNDIIIFTGGTGLSARDVTPESVRPLLDREIPGIAETARSYGQDRMPLSMLSRAVAGMKGRTLVLTLPGSEKAAIEYMDAVFPAVLHIFNIIGGGGHD
jgi:cyclic pyranopterin phosphate synthase